MSMFGIACPRCDAKTPWYRINSSFICKACGERLRADMTKAIVVAIFVAIPFEAAVHLAFDPTAIRLALKWIVGLAVIAWSLTNFADVRTNASSGRLLCVR